MVVEKLSKFTGEHHELLTPGEYTQLAGRAGRAGSTRSGTPSCCGIRSSPSTRSPGLASRRTYALTSSFRATYNMAANLVQRYERERRAGSSTCRSRSTTPTATRWRSPGSSNAPRRSSRAPGTRRGSRNGDIEEYRALLASLDDARRAAHAAQASRLDKLRPGDVVMAPKRGGRAVVLKQERGRSGNRVLALTQQRTMVRWTPDDFPGPIRRLANLELPRPYAPPEPELPESRGRDAAPAPRQQRVRRRRRRTWTSLRPRAHPLHRAEGTEVALRGAWQADRIA